MKLHTRFYQVYMEVEEINTESGEKRRHGERTEVATFLTLDEASDFCFEIQQRHAVRVTGEKDVADEMNTPEDWAAGD